jgi:hypothetical protein
MKLEAKTFMAFFNLIAFQLPGLQPIVALADGLMLVFQHPAKNTPGPAGECETPIRVNKVAACGNGK